MECDLNSSTHVQPKMPKLIWGMFSGWNVGLLLLSYHFFNINQVTSENLILHNVMGMIGIGSLLIGWTVPKFLLKNSQPQTKIEQISKPSPTGDLVSFSVSQFKIYLIRLVLFEFTTILGLIICVLGAGSLWAIALSFLATASVIASFPSERFLIDWTKGP